MIFFNRLKLMAIFYIITMHSLNSSQIKKALITGITGQDGYYLAQLLLKKGYEIHGIKRLTTANIDQQDKKTYVNNITYHLCDLDEIASLTHLLKEIEPDEIYNLAVQSQIHVTTLVPEYSARSNAMGALNMLEAIKLARLEKKTKFFQAASCEIFGQAQEIPQSETTPLEPSSSYGVAKLYAYWITKNYRESYGMYACNGILFNHESPRRGETFVTRKITRAAAAIKLGLQDTLSLGNLNAQKDWGYAGDYVQAMWLMLQQNQSDDYIIATGKSHTVRDFVNAAFKAVGIKLIWQGDGVDEIGIDKATGKTIVKVDPRYFRPIDVNFSLGDITKIKNQIGWQPKTNFKQLVKIMVENDIKKYTKKKHKLKNLVKNNEKNI